MKKYNKTITVEVSVDAIAEHLLNSMDKEFKHKENVVEAIIGPALEKGTLSYIYNALYGYNNGLNFAVGEEVMCTTKEYMSYQEGDGLKEGYREIGKVTILEIGEYKDKKLLVQYVYTDSNGKNTQKEMWVRHTSCSKIPVAPEENNAAQ